MSKDPIRDGKAFNIYNGCLVQNWIPCRIELYDLKTHSEYTDWEGNRKKYLTNIIVIDQNHIKIYVMFDDGSTIQLLQAPILDNIRSVSQLKNIVLVETYKKVFGLVYDQGHFKTIYMLSLEFLNLHQEYKSFIRVDPFDRYFMIVAGQHLLLCTSKQHDLRQYGNTQFERVNEEVIWKIESLQFQAIYSFRLSEVNIREIYDVCVDRNGLYFLCREGSQNSIYSMRMQQIVQEKKETLSKILWGSLPPSTKMITLTPKTESYLLLLSQNKLIVLPNKNTHPNSQPIQKVIENITNIRINNGTIFLSVGHKLYTLTIFPDKMEVKECLESKSTIRDFGVVDKFSIVMTYNRIMVNRVTDQYQLMAFLNSLIDFHLSSTTKAVIAIERMQNSSRLIVVKRMFRPSDRVIINQKKIFFEKLQGVEDVKGIGNMIAVKNQGIYTLYKESEELGFVRTDVDGGEWLSSAGPYLIILRADQLSVYHENTLNFVKQVNFSNLSRISHIGPYVVYVGDNIVYRLHLPTAQQSSFSIMLPEQCIKCCVSYKPYNQSEDKHLLLLYYCYKTHLQIFSIGQNSCRQIHKTHFINQGLPYLNNDKPSDYSYLRSIYEPTYVLSLQTTKATANVQNMLVSGTTLIFQTEANQFFVYRAIPIKSELGMLFIRVILPLYISKPSEGPLVKYSDDLIRFGNRVLYRDVVMEISEPFTYCFQHNDIWTLHDNKLKPVDLKGEVVSGKLIQVLSEYKHYIGVENSPECYCVYAKNTVELYDKEFNPQGNFSIQEGIGHHEVITAKMHQSYLGVSSFQHYKKQGFESIKFQFSLYDTKVKTTRYHSTPMDEAIVGIKFTRSGKILLASNTRIYVYEIKNKLDERKIFNYSQRVLMSSVGCWFSKASDKMPHLLLISGAYGGLSYISYDDERLLFQENWFEPLKFGIREVEIFYYGKVLKGIIADHQKNIVIVDLKKAGMEKLADFNIGSRVNKLIRVDETICACLANGSVHVFIPIALPDPDISLINLQHKIEENIPTLGGLNERDYRKLRQSEKSYKFSCKGNFLEYSMLQMFMSLSKPLQNAILFKATLKEEQLRSMITKDIYKA